MATARKVYDYKTDAVRDRIAGAFRKRGGEATVADLVAATGLPKAQVDAELPAVADEFGGRLKVTDSGEILYSFPRGFHSRYRGLGPSLRRGWKAFGKGLAAVAAFLFKIWIVVMLVGYFLLFILLALLAVVASFAMSAAGGERNSSSRSRGRGGSFMIAGRLLELIMRIWFYNEVFKSPGQRRLETDARARSRADARPLHKAIFSFVFGEPDPNAGLDESQKRAFVAMVREKRGIVILEDFMALTGLPPADAEREINRYLYEFEGSPEASEQGTVHYRFDALMRRAQADATGASDSSLARLRPFSANKKSSNFWYAAINGVNLLFGSYFLFSALSLGNIPKYLVDGFSYFYWFVLNIPGFLSGYLDLGTATLPLPLVAIGLGAVPAAFSVLFWLVPALRAARLKRENERIKEANQRRLAYARALASPSSVAPLSAGDLPAVARASDPTLPAKLVEELAAYEEGEPGPDGRTWRLKELERKLADVEGLRRSVDMERYRLGGVAFDSDS